MVSSSGGFEAFFGASGFDSYNVSIVNEYDSSSISRADNKWSIL